MCAQHPTPKKQAWQKEWQKKVEVYFYKDEIKNGLILPVEEYKNAARTDKKGCKLLKQALKDGIAYYKLREKVENMRREALVS